MINKRVLITGGAGFIGSNLTKRLIGLGAKVTVVVKYKSIIDNIRLSSIWNEIEVLEADLRNIDSLRLMRKRRFDIVYHLAAYNHVGDSFIHVNESLISNLVSTSNLLESGPEFDRFIYISSSEVYGFQETVPFHEDLMPFPISPYSIGKYAGELYSRMKRHQTNKNILCLRPFNTFGPYQSEKAVIPEIIIKCLLGEPIDTTKGNQMREFNYVENIIDAFIITGETDIIFEGVINIGSNNPVSIKDLVEKIHTLADSKSELNIGRLPYRPTEIWKMCSCFNRAKEILHWAPKISFDEGLKLTIGWFKKYKKLFFNYDSPLNML